MRVRLRTVAESIDLFYGCNTQREGNSEPAVRSKGPTRLPVGSPALVGSLHGRGESGNSRRTTKEFQMEKAYRRVARRFAALLAVASFAALLLVAPAFAATSAQQGYSTVAGEIEQTTSTPAAHVTTTPVAHVTSSSANQLPFTGIDVLAIVASVPRCLPSASACASCPRVHTLHLDATPAPEPRLGWGSGEAVRPAASAEGRPADAVLGDYRRHQLVGRDVERQVPRRVQLRSSPPRASAPRSGSPLARGVRGSIVERGAAT